MFGVSAPSSADSLIALAKFVQSPELQEKLEELSAAERRLKEVQAAITVQEEKVRGLKADLAREQAAWHEVKIRMEDFPTREAALKADLETRERALAEGQQSVTNREHELASARLLHENDVEQMKAQFDERERLLVEREVALERSKQEHNIALAEHARRVHRIREAVAED